MMRKCFVTLGGMLPLLMVLSLPLAGAWGSSAQDQQPSGQQQQSGQQPTYTLAEYNAFQAAANEKDAKQKAKLLDDFVAKFPNSTLMPYVYQSYWDAYNQLKNYPKVVEYTEKFMALGDKAPLQNRLQAAYAHSLVLEQGYNAKDPNAKDYLSKGRDIASLGLKLLDQLQKPANMTDQQFTDQVKKPVSAVLNAAAGFASLQAKDYKAAVDSYRATLTSVPNDTVTYYRLGVAYLLQEPPQALDGFWALARAVALKGPVEAQARDYLRKRMLAYQQPGCDNLIDAQMNEWISLAANSADRPATLTIPSSTDLEKIRQGSTILTVLADLKAGGDKAKMTWFAVCGSEFQDVPGRIIEMTSDDAGTTFKLYTGASQEEMDAAADPNSVITIPGQPEVKRFEKGDYFRYTGTLVSYDPQPLLVHWDKAKINAEDIPPEKGEAGKRRKLPKKPGKQS
jgi:hypothetical protein